MNKKQKVFPTMITPFKDNGEIDYERVEKLVEYYWETGCDGIFSACLSSEIFSLSENERVKLAATVKKKADQLHKNDPGRDKMEIVASGHISDGFEDQVRELTAIAATGVDAVVLITNRFDIENTSDDKWIEDAEKLIEALPRGITLGLYECPVPYKRLITPKMLEWCKKKGNFKFIKDTCCDINMIAERMDILKNSSVELYNANAQTYLDSLKLGAAGYCGVMVNTQPKLYKYLTENYKADNDKAELIEDVLSLAAFTESLHYPICAKYYLSEFENIDINTYSRTHKTGFLSDYEKSIMKQMKNLTDYISKKLAL